MKKKLVVFVVAMAVLLVFSSFVSVNALAPRKGWIHYVDIEVTWDGSSPEGSWYVYAVNKEGYDLGDLITGCDDCLEMHYNFEFRGNTLSFDETYVPSVSAYPQTHHVVLHDPDGDGVYTGKSTARYDFPTRPNQIYMDVIEYEITTEDGVVTWFFYVQHEYYKDVGKK